ncbi:preprotein translocase subunit YajC [Sphingomonas sp. LB-2]|uniref:preprotein translocase subunit YajC n=1 Tax=Sphingomonas caeni TaxID=2984949 RepID=UPI00222ECEE2|nr:preprotein translocase subunit YajC [Sphingomonas caeni]MCW3848631.1 preprotein translocase subunit YajC [Sphingomonas caeni]
MFITPILAAASGAAATGGTFAMVQTMGPLLIMFVAFYFLLIRPQQKRAKDHAAQIAAVKKGDTVVTAGGIVGKVVKTDDQFADVEIAPNVKVKVVKSTLNDVQPAGGAKPAND